MEDKSSSLITIEPLDISYPSSIASPNVSSDSNPTPVSSLQLSDQSNGDALKSQLMRVNCLADIILGELCKWLRRHFLAPGVL